MAHTSLVESSSPGAAIGNLQMTQNDTRASGEDEVDQTLIAHENFMTWKHFTEFAHNWIFVKGIHRLPVNIKGQ